MKRIKTRYIAVTAVMGAVGAILMALEVSVPLMPSFIKLDFSELPALITAFSFGPVYGVLVCLIKNLLHLFVSQTGGIGELSNFILGAVFTAAAGIFYRRHKTRGGALWACVIGSALMAAVSLLTNLYIVYPFYIKLFFAGDTDAVVAVYQLLYGGVKNLFQCLLVFNVPFTFVKGVANSLLCFAVYKKISPLLRGKY